MLHTANHSSSSLHWCVVKAVFLTTFIFCKISTNAAYGWKPAHIYLYFCGITCSLNHLLFYNNISENIIIANHISPGKLGSLDFFITCKWNILMLATMSVTPLNESLQDPVEFHSQTWDFITVNAHVWGHTCAHCFWFLRCSQRPVLVPVPHACSCLSVTHFCYKWGIFICELQSEES